MADTPNENEQGTPDQAPPDENPTPNPTPDTQPAPPVAPTSGGTDEQAPKKGYGKRPWWHWLLIYVAVGAVVYFIIYAVLVLASGDNGSGNGGIQY